MASQGASPAARDARASGRVGSAWYALAVLLIIYGFNYADRYLIAGLAEPIRHDLGLDDAFIGLLMGPAFALLYSIAAVPIAWLADRYSRITILSVGCLVWSLFTFLSGLANDGWTLAAMRVGVGIGEAAFVAPAYSVLADRFAPERRGLAFAILGLGIYLGQMGGYVVGPAIAAHGDWRDAFFWVGGIGGAIGLIAWMTVTEPKRGVHADRTQAQPVERPALWTTFLTLWRRRVYRQMNIGLVLGTFSGTAFGMWAPSLLVRRFDVPLAEATGLFGTAFGLSAIVGMIGFGAVSDRLVRRDGRWPLRMAAIALTIATLSITGATLAPSLTVVTLLAIPSGLLGGGWAVGVMTPLQQVLDDRIRATGTALFTLVNMLFGMLTAPYVVGQLSDPLGGEAQGLQTALLIVIMAGFPGALLLWRAADELVRFKRTGE
ncbi:Predicted arabinose efflux permease, MFS family [Sphingomonas laterariae]|uniref:Predicted arabinose efflux permease, MFS family n=1 Tax=Edaphosphingomonas laterariae TaxID=861865 RepID=A0A239GXT9_9SPHN|nr:MFS transporter [Sphingomonas laterariae]SNS73741.1 Predicted arabinose efflux permease, MFS family [Sphingomonas laterariae]